MDVLEAQNRAIANIGDAAGKSSSSAQAVVQRLAEFLDVAGRTEQAAIDVAGASHAIEAANRSLRAAVDEFLKDIAA